MMMMSSVQPFSALGDPMNKVSISALLALMVEIRFFNPFNDSAMSVVSSAYRKLLYI